MNYITMIQVERAGQLLVTICCALLAAAPSVVASELPLHLRTFCIRLSDLHYRELSHNLLARSL